MGTDLALADPGTMTPVERKEMYDLLLADVENLDDAKLAMLEALELAMDTDKVTAFPKAEIVHQGTPGISGILSVRPTTRRAPGASSLASPMTSARARSP